MRYRCERPTTPWYHNYGGRGIRVCEEWSDFAVFKAWAISTGYGPGLTIERDDNDGPYSPDNCRWATRGEQNRNRRDNRWIEAFGERKCAEDWLSDPRCRVSKPSLYHRIESGMTVEDALSTPPHTARLARPREPVARTCRECKQAFSTISSRAIYCSGSCKHRAFVRRKRSLIPGQKDAAVEVADSLLRETFTGV